MCEGRGVVGGEHDKALFDQLSLSANAKFKLKQRNEHLAFVCTSQQGYVINNMVHIFAQSTQWNEN